jgi:aminoglycoside phosphotransferase (APT) family kinase protein
VPSKDFAAFDPFRRIRPRLHLAPPALRDRIDRLMYLPMPTSGHVCHGDFHPGQVIRDAAGTSWLIDLDDLAVACPAADLGNLIAYLATSPPRSDTITTAVDQLTPAVMAAWASEPQTLNMAEITYFTEIALIRRALKRAERGDLAVLEQISDPRSAA